MGVAITKIIPKQEISLDDLTGKTLAVDGYNMLYQFLTTIRGPDGTPLSDSHGNTTSHLIGLFSRITNLLAKNIKFIFVFDGEIPELKNQELQKRRERKEAAQEKFEEAKQKEDTEGMKKFAQQTARLTTDMVIQAKQLLDALGVPWVDAPSEGEAQAAALVKQGLAWAVVSQDADALLYESPRIVKNLAITGKRKLPGRMAYINVEPELITIKDVLKELQLDIEQLRVLAVLIGTDYNVGGVKGIGPKKGLKLLQEHGKDFEKVFTAVKWNEHWDVPPRIVLNVFEDMPVIEPENITFGSVDEEKVRELLIKKHDFSDVRVENTLEKLRKSKANNQKGLGEFF